MDELYLAVSAIGGAVVAGVLGWFKAGTPLSARKIMPTVLRSLVAGVGFAALQNFTGTAISVTALATAFISGAGIDVIGHRLAGTIKPE